MLGGDRGGIELSVLGMFRRRKGRYRARGFRYVRRRKGRYRARCFRYVRRR